MEKVCPWCGQPSDRGQLKDRTEQNLTGGCQLMQVDLYNGRKTVVVVVIVQ